MATSEKPVEEPDCQFRKEICEAGKSSKPPRLSRRGKIILGVSGALFAGASIGLAPFVIPGLRKIALPYIPASDVQVNNVMKALSGRSGSLIDIGSGDGRIVLTAARSGFNAHGVEINRWLILYSKWKAWQEGLYRDTSFFKKDLWKTDLSVYSNVVVFGVESMMEPLKNKLEKEMLPGARVVACRFPLPNLEPAITLGSGIDTVWLYQFPCNSSSSHSDS